ncbi:reverse transcriptase-like protein [Senna tora]|uniref:Reverse transcriptase-like protein n=1 Tax=Senna tora TaxID=362788 RepID=A0A834X3M3_9FABA|nr:reverse transcriptase-like protein [Senna tora]
MDLLAIRSRIEELTELHKRYGEDIPESNPLDAEKLLQDSALELETRLQQIVSECCDVGFLEDDELGESSFSSSEFVTGLDQETAKASEGTDSHILEDNQSALTTVHQGNNLELLELDNQIDEMKSTLKSLQDLKHMVQWSDVVEQIEEALTGLKVLSLDENCISKSSLQWLIRKVQDRIILSIGVLRYSLEYLDRDETIVAHMAGGIDAFIKLSHSWPITNSPLKLISLKGSDHLKEISLSFLCKVEIVDTSRVHLFVLGLLYWQLLVRTSNS